MFCLHIWLLVLLTLFVNVADFYQYGYKHYYNDYADYPRRVGKDSSVDKIVNGHDTYIEDYPYQVFMEISFSTETFICGGSILTDWLIITAARCVYNEKPLKKTKIRYGSSSAFIGGRTTYATNIYIHGDYPPSPTSTIKNDIALLKVHKKIIFDVATSIKMNYSPIDIGLGMVFGWGVVNPSSHINNIPKLQKANIIVMDYKNCETLRGSSSINIYADNLCGVNVGDVNVCTGDFGGPLMVKNQLVGISSDTYGSHCNSTNINSRYTSIAFHRNFIQRIMKYVHKL